MEYSEDDVEKFEEYIKNIGRFQEAYWERESRMIQERVEVMKRVWMKKESSNLKVVRRKTLQAGSKTRKREKNITA